MLARGFLMCGMRCLTLSGQFLEFCIGLLPPLLVFLDALQVLDNLGLTAVSLQPLDEDKYMFANRMNTRRIESEVFLVQRHIASNLS